MASESTTRWPLLNERVPMAPAAARIPGRRPPRSVWLLTGLAFICGGLVSAAGFSIGWRHQAQRNTAAETALATATARTHTLERRASLLQAFLSDARSKAAAAAESEQSIARNATRIGNEATASSDAAVSLTSDAGMLTASAARIGSELKTLETYLTTTPARQLDPGYISSQVTYLSRQLTKLQSAGASLDTSVASFESAVRTVSRDARATATR